MAGARVEQLGSIFKRVEGLYKGGVMSKQDLPLWFNIYKRFPPHREPTMDRTEPEGEVKSLIYLEDHVRADMENTYFLPKSFVYDINAKATQKTPTDRYTEYFTKAALDENNTVDKIREKVEEAMSQDGYKVVKKSQ